MRPLIEETLRIKPERRYLIQGSAAGSGGLVALSPTGYLVVSDASHNGLFRVELSGDRRLIRSTSRSVPSFQNPVGVAIDSTGTIFVSDNNSGLWVLHHEPPRALVP